MPCEDEEGLGSKKSKLRLGGAVAKTAHFREASALSVSCVDSETSYCLVMDWDGG